MSRDAHGSRLDAQSKKPPREIVAVFLFEHRTQNTERRTQNTERRTQNTEHRTQNTERRTQNTERRTQNAEHRIQTLTIDADILIPQFPKSQIPKSQNPSKKIMHYAL